MKKLSFFMFLLALTLFSCRDESIIEDTTTIPIVDETNYELTVFGTVKDEQGMPVSDALVTVDNQSYLTNELGLFYFEEAYAGNLGTQFGASKEGYLYGGFRLYAQDVGTNKVEITMMTAKDLGDASSFVETKINVTPNTTLTFPNSAFTLNGTDVYAQNVNVFGNWIDPTSDDLLTLTPGDLSGVNADNERVILSSFGMMGIELRTDSGEEIQIMDGQNVELAFEVPSDIMAFAPNTIPLWTFDEDRGMWMEEGSATLQGNQYVGNVSHFSWWNCDLPNTTLPFCIKITDETTGNPLANVKVFFKNLNGFGQAWGTTDDRGFLCGFLPENVELLVTIGNSEICPGQLPTKLVGPFTQADLPILIDCPVDLEDVVVNTISGTVTDCTTSDPIANAFVLFDYINGNEAVLTDADGNYSQDILSCGDLDELNIKAFDLVSLKEQNEVLTDLPGGAQTVDLSLCNDLVVTNWFISTTTEVFQADDVIGKAKPNETLIIVENTNDLLGFGCFGLGICSGSYVGELGAFTVEVDVLIYGDVGETIGGTFTGTNNLGEPVSGSFNADRVE